MICQQCKVEPAYLYTKFSDGKKLRLGEKCKAFYEKTLAEVEARKKRKEAEEASEDKGF